jgi:radical SAM superfamily enzyme YgiQ (UPF0313 family)
MRALLINPWVYDFKAFDFWNKPVGLLIVATILKKLGVKIDFIDCMDRSSPYFKTNTKTDRYGRGKYSHEIIEKPELFKQVPRHYKRYGIPRDVFLKVVSNIKQPDIIFVTSAMTYWYPGVFEVIKILKGKFPNKKIVLGGIYATLCENHAKKYSGADIIFTGPSEKHLIELLSDLGFIKNVSSDFDYIIPDFSLYKELNYGVILTSRGCPFNCTYCATKVLCPEFQVIPNKFITDQLDYFSDKTNNIAFFDDALLYNKNFPELLKEIIKRKYNLNFHTSNGLHCRYINKKNAQLMFRSNFKTMYLSLETTNPEVQEQTGNKVNTAEFINAVKILTEIGFSPDSIHTYILFGMPGQHHDEIIDSIKLCRSLEIHPHLCEFSPIPHTKEFEKTDFDENTDPLYNNNLFYTWYYQKPKPEIYQRIKRLLSQKI